MTTQIYRCPHTLGAPKVTSSSFHYSRASCNLALLQKWSAGIDAKFWSNLTQDEFEVIVILGVNFSAFVAVDMNKSFAGTTLECGKDNLSSLYRGAAERSKTAEARSFTASPPPLTSSSASASRRTSRRLDGV